ncbi:low temperature requirement protein A [Frankia sp. Cr2]|uniref:low temperature requirement protein A n=1 Tax=Frankia sp. Cr2 TaxID=3073932 RepID=UPI002AD31651|nr:low temperature requirement protein A [Frankia sp. Cr2]
MGPGTGTVRQPGAAERTRSVIPDIPYIRGRSGGEQRATFFELYFDLVYVFAVTRISHHLLADLSWIGAAQAAFFLVAVYWAWNYTTWMANWFDPETVPVRLVLIYVMLASFLMAVAIPEGSVDLAPLFAASYTALQIGRNTFVVWVTPPGAFNENFRQILAWSVLSAPLWVVGGILSGEPRWLLWVAALALDLAAPLARFWVPRAGPTPMSQWEVEGSHFAERFQLFVIIALGESIVLAGVTASDAGLRGSVVVTLGFAFLTSTALWWLYFGQVAGSVARRISRSAADESGQIGRDVYTYLHLPIIAGIVLTAVGVELVIVHPGGELHTAGALVTLGGPALYLLGLMACAARIGHRPSWPQMAAVVVLLAAVPLAAHVYGLLVLIVLTVGLIALVVVDQIRPQLADPPPHQ